MSGRNRTYEAEPMDVAVSRKLGNVSLDWKTSASSQYLSPMDAIELARQLTYHAEQLLESQVEPSEIFVAQPPTHGLMR